MQINTARQAWHDCTDPQVRGGLAGLAERQRLGTAVQTSRRGPGAERVVHATLAGWVQSAIDQLPAHVRIFGDFMYSARQTLEIQGLAENLVFAKVFAGAGRITPAKRARACAVIKGVMVRYRYMHQGGYQANPDPLADAEAFRAWLLSRYGVAIDSRNWTREWNALIDSTFAACEALDKQALNSLTIYLNKMNKVA